MSKRVKSDVERDAAAAMISLCKRIRERAQERLLPLTAGVVGHRAENVLRICNRLHSELDELVLVLDTDKADAEGEL